MAAATTMVRVRVDEKIKAQAVLKDWKRLSHSGRYDMNGLKKAMLLLVENNGPLPPEWLDHPLTGDWLGHRECHVSGDFLLI
jgi:mRNA interferase YafQ